MGLIPSYDAAVAVLLAVSLLVAFVARAVEKAGTTQKLFSPFTQFITREDVDAALADEEIDKAKLKALSGETADPKTTALAHITDASGVTESTPLLAKARHALPTGGRTWKTNSLAALGAIEALGRTAILVHVAVKVAGRNESAKNLASPVIFLVAWTYAALKPIVAPRLTVPYGVLAVHGFSFLSAIGFLYAVGLKRTDETSNTSAGLVLQISNLFIAVAGVSIIGTMPIHHNGVPAVDRDGLLPAKDDYVTLYGWLSFDWVSDYVNIGVTRTVEESDVWQLSQLLRARVVMSKFRHWKSKTLLRRLLSANALDLAIDCVLTVVSALLAVVQPYFLSLILRALEGEATVSNASLPFRPIALSLPQSYYTLPARLVSHTSETLGIHPSSALFTTAMTPGDNRQMAYFYATIAFLCQLIRAQSNLQHLYYARRATIRAQGELIGSIYEKTLVRKDISGVVASDAKKGKGDESKKDAAVRSADVGKIVSLIATDATSTADAANTFTRFYEIPIFFIGSASLLYSLMGWTAFVGYLAFLIVMPINWVLLSAALKVRRTLMDVRDKRMREVNQAVQAIKFIKFFAWESKWVERIMEARLREMQWLRRSKWIEFSMSFFWDVLPLLVTIISFMAYVLIAKGELTVAIAFPALTAFNLLTQSITTVSQLSNFLIQDYAYVMRIEKYLNEEEVPEWVSWRSPSRLASPHSDSASDDRVGFSNASFAWVTPNKLDTNGSDKEAAGPKRSILERVKGVFGQAPVKSNTESLVVDEDEDEEDKPFELKNLDIMFKLGAINLISGPTGSGKSSLLSALLGEMHCTSGKVHLAKNPLVVDPATGLRAEVSFCAQQPWLQHQSIRDNILFGLTFDEKRYKEVLRICQLQADLDLLDDGDLTEIGEKGVSLSGGQKARVALARAIYARSKTVILDDVLSAVDSHTAEKLISQCLTGPIMKGRTILLVTHHVDLVIRHCGYVVQLEDGVIAAQGTPDELRRGGFLASIRETAQKEEMAVEPLGDEIKAQEETPEVQLKDKASRKLVDKEEKAQGRVRMSVYGIYLKAASWPLMSLAVILILAHYLGDLTQRFWIRFWGESYDKPSGQISFGFPNPSDNVWPYLFGYIFLQLLTSCITVISQLPTIYAGLRASRELYQTMLLSVIRAPSRWFDKTPSGRILNRFSKDIDTIDSALQHYVVLVIETALASTVTIATILWGTPLFIFPLIGIAALQYYFSRGYVSVSRDTRRLESNMRSPMISAFSELTSGIATVRAFGAEQFFANKVYERLDRVLAASYYYWMCNRWLLYRLDSIGAFVVLFASLFSISSEISPGLAGIVISSSSTLIMNLYWLLRYYTDMEQSMNSVERVGEYMDIPSEPAAIVEESRPPAYWPSNNGGMSVENLVLKYSPELDPVLHDISFDVKPAEKIGLVGRTGSGKSTLALAFFRFVDPTSGKIVIDGIDITSIGLEDLRSRLTIIPQDAVLFSGTIRDNLDPFHEHSDEDCLDALRRVQIRTSASGTSTANTSRHNSRPGTPHDNSPAESADESAATASTLVGTDRSKTVITLDTQVSESGNNFSAGQRQLIAMARALLRRSRFVVMDESTASVDFATDLKIQEAIREEYKDSILITIAHRLRTVIDYDRVLVLDAGKIAEYDTPKNLLSKPDGIFYGMCKKSGDFEELKEAAEKRSAW